jgi:hemerythrin-like domain-containing protein
MTRPTAAVPRRAGEPAPDLTDYVVVHRAMTVDARRLAQAAARPGDRARAAALRTYLTGVSNEIRSHHRVEDDAVWPLVSTVTGQDAAGLSGLTDDHHRLDPLLDAADALAGELVSRPADAALAHRLAGTLDQLSALLDAHVDDEERTVFPLIREYVSLADYAWLQRRFRGGLSVGALSFVVPWVVRHATPQERAHLLAEAGWPLRVLLSVFRGRFAARERVVFG